MNMEIDDDFADEIVVKCLADSYVGISEMAAEPDKWHEDDVAAWAELLPAIKLVGGWYSVDFDKEIKRVYELKS